MAVEFPAAYWKDYELLDSGNGEKLERFGKYVLRRPEPKALWAPSEPDWNRKAHVVFKPGAGFGKAGKEDSGTWEKLKENIENICQDFVSNIFFECQTKNQNTYTLKVCQDFVSDIFSECKRRNSNLNHACKDFVGDPFDSCLEDQVIKRKKY